MNSTSIPHLARIDDLTRRYARFSRHNAGLGAVWAGLCFAGLAAAILVLHISRYLDRPAADTATGFWRFLMNQSYHNPGFWLLAAAFVLPGIWYLGRAWIQRHIYERDGTVVASEKPADASARQLYTAFEIAAPAVLIPLEWLLFAMKGFPPDGVLRMIAASLLILALPFAGRRLASSLDRSALFLLVLGCASVVEPGYAESLLVCMVLYAILGLVMAGFGIHSHAQFRKVRRELGALTPAESAPGSISTPDEPAGSLSR